jgi:hypothetical protein
VVMNHQNHKNWLFTKWGGAPYEFITHNHKVKVKFSPLQALEALRVVRG